MRRKEREITDENEIKLFLDEQKVLRVAFYDDGEIYVVPVNYGYSRTDGKYTFYFHGAAAGRKYELGKTGPAVGFEIDGGYRVMESETACGFSAAFQSVIGTGRLRLIEELNEKEAALGLIMKQATGKGTWQYGEKMLQTVAVFRLDVEKLSSKRNG